MKQLIAVFFVLFTVTLSLAAFGDTPAPGTVKAKLFSGDGSISFGGTGTSLNVNVTNPGGGTQTVNQGTAGASAWPVSLASQPLPTGAATETSLLGVNTNLTSILAKMPTLVSGNMPVAIQGTVPVSGTFWQATQPVSGTFWQATQPVSGSLGRSWTLSGGTDSVAITGTVPISAAALPLPSGAATSALQTSGNASLTSIDGKTPALGQALVGASVPVVLPATQITALTPPTTVTVTQATGTNLHAVIDSSALPSGAATSALQTSGNSSLTTIASNTTGVATAANQTTGNSSLGSIVSNTANIPPLGQALAAASAPVVLPAAQISALTPLSTVAVTQATGSNLHTVVDSGSVTATISGTPNVVVTSSVLPTGAATSANQSTEISSLSSIDTKLTGAATAANQSTEISALNAIDAGIPTALGQTTMSASMPVTLSSDQTAVQVSQPDLLLTGQGTQTVIGQNILLVSAGTGNTDVSGYRSGSVQIVSTGTSGTFIFENSNDGTNFQTMPVYNSALVTGTPITAAITATSSQFIYTFPIRARYVRVRIATTIGGGSLQAYTRISQESWSPAVMTVAQSTAGNLNVTPGGGTITTVTGVTTVASVTSDNLAAPTIVADVASAALTTTTTTAAFTPTNGVGYKIQIPVTVVSGTTPTVIVGVQESADSGTNWTTVYTFPTISVTGFYESPPLFFKGNRVRYVQTVAGTTPSFTRAINRLQMSAVAAAPVNNNATFASAAVSGVTTLTAPANAIGFVLQNLNSNTTSLRYAVGATASSSNGMQLEPGRDSGEIHAGQNISICPESGTITYAIQWIQQ